MGFSVTATHAIFFIALLTAGSAGMNAYFESSRDTQDARITWSRAATSAVDTNITILTTACPGSTCTSGETMTVELINSGTTVVDMRNLTFIVEGRAHTISNFTSWRVVQPSTIPDTDLILPGETGEILIANAVIATVTDTTANIQVVTLDGVIGRR